MIPRITIVIPTYNRTSYLKRILDYYARYYEAKDACIFVADSSSDENKAANQNITRSFPGLNIRYLGYASTTYPWNKFADALGQVQTAYSVLCADDDFVTPNGISQSVDFLEEHRDFALAHGRYIGFFTAAKKGRNEFRWAPSYALESIDFPLPADRLRYHLSSYKQATTYAVHRADLHKMTYLELLQAGFDEMTGPALGEIMLSMLDVIYGKLKCLDLLYAARDGSSAAGGVRQYPSLDEAIARGVYDAGYAKFRNCLASHLSRQSGLGIAESEELINGAMSGHIERYHGPLKGRAKVAATLGQALTRLNLPDWADKEIRRLYTRASGRKNYPADMPEGSAQYPDFDRIRKQVLDSLNPD